MSNQIISAGQNSAGLTATPTDDVEVEAGGTAENTAVDPLAYFYVHAGGQSFGATVFGVESNAGQAFANTVGSGGNLEVLNGASDTGATILGFGAALDAGTMVAATIENLGNITVSAGAVASNTEVQAGGLLDISGTASATLLSGTGAYGAVEAGASVDGFTIEAGGFGFILAGGVASGVTLDGGTEYNDGLESGTQLVSGQDFVQAGGTSEAASVQSGAVLDAASGVAIGATVENGGTAEALLGGVLSGITVQNGGTDSVGVSALASGTTLDGGTEFVLAMGTAIATSVASAGTQTLSSGGFASATSVGDGEMVVEAGGSASSAAIASGGSMTISSGGNADHVTVLDGGSVLVLSGATVLSATASGGFISVLGSARGLTLGGGDGEVFAGGQVTSLSITQGNGTLEGDANSVSIRVGGLLVENVGGSAGAVKISAGGSAVLDAVVSGLTVSGVASAAIGGTAVVTATTVAASGAIVVAGQMTSNTISGGSASVYGGGSALANTIAASGVLAVSSAGYASATSVTSGGSALVLNSGTIAATDVGAGGTLEVSSGGTAGGVLVSGGGKLLVSAAGTVSGLAISGSGAATIGAGGVVGGGIVMAGSGGRISFAAIPGSNVISGFTSGDSIVLEGFSATASSFDPATGLTLSNASGGSETVVISGGFTTTSFAVQSVASSGSGGASATITIACFAAGTKIATPRGEVAVERLGAGEQVVAIGHGIAPVRWLGRRRLEPRRHADPDAVMPVRITRDAFADGVPLRPLLLSPDHAVLAGNVLVPVRHLVNGASIARLACRAVTYWHLELPAHDVVLAEGLAVESYLDTGNRAAFEGGPTTSLHPDFARRRWAQAGCAALVEGGTAVGRLHARLLARAVALGWRRDADPGLALHADTRRLRHSEGTIALPRGARRLRLASRRFVPAEHGLGEDRRELGVAVCGLWLDDRPVGLADPRLTEGWHTQEAGWRWTDGNALIELGGAGSVRLALAALPARYWRPAGARIFCRQREPVSL